MPVLYIVATPIGNLQDITFRAIRVLKEVGVIFCEDTRTTRKLTERYGISTPLESYPADFTLGVRHPEYPKYHPKAERILQFLKDGKDIALVSEAGTPGISDPGSRLVALVREKLGESVQIVPIPGASALTTAISAAGIPASDFLFLGFLPHKKGRSKYFTEIAGSKRTVVFYESPHRILKTLSSFNEHIPERKIVLAHELTKIHEEFIEGLPQDLLEHLEKHGEKVCGEFVVIIAPV